MKQKNNNYCNFDLNLSENQNSTLKNENKIKFVLLLTVVTMILEITTGMWTSSMALLADGWHMGSHAGALFITFLSYRLARSSFTLSKLNFGGGKFLPLGAYSNALLLGVIAFFMIYESIERLIFPRSILFNEAIIVAFFGLFINILCAYLLKEDSHSHAHLHIHDHGPKHDHQHHSKDLNLHAAYIHIIADALTSVLAIVALFLGKYYSLFWMDAVAGLLGAVLILKWSYGLLKDSAVELLDGYVHELHPEKIKNLFLNDDVQILDIHVWKVAPGRHHCEMIVATKLVKGVEYYKELIQKNFPIQHIIVEEKKL